MSNSIFSGTKKPMAQLLILSVVINILMLTVPLYMMQIYDRVLVSGSVDTLIVLTLLAIFALTIIGLLETIRRIVLSRIGSNLEARFSEPLLEMSLTLGRDNTRSHSVLRDLATLKQFLGSSLAPALMDLPTVPIYLLILFLVHSALGWVAIAAVFLLFLISLGNHYLTKASTIDSAKYGGEASKWVSSLDRNSEVIQAMGMAHNATSNWKRSLFKSLKKSDESMLYNASSSGFTRYVRLGLQIGMLGFGAYFVLSEHLSPGIIIAASVISGRALAPIDQSISGWRTITNSFHTYERLKTAIQLLQSKNLSDSPPPICEIEIKKLVHIPAPGANAVLKNISFKIAKGELIGVVGPTGAGKTTLLRALAGVLEPTSGDIRYGGHRIDHWQNVQFGQHIGYMSQTSQLFPTSVAQNIARMDTMPDMSAVISAAELAGCHQLIQSMPDGYDTLIGAENTGVSAGQAQRIALARAMYGNPQIIILDEPNSFFDNDGDNALAKLLMKLKAQGTTCIISTHKTNIFPQLSKLLVLREGALVSYGPVSDIVVQGAKHKRHQPTTDMPTIFKPMGV